MAIYAFYGRNHSVLAAELSSEIARHGVSPAGSLDTTPMPRKKH